MGLSKVHVNQGGVDWSFLINEVNLLFYIIRRNTPHKTKEKNYVVNDSILEKWHLKWALFQ